MQWYGLGGHGLRDRRPGARRWMAAAGIGVLMPLLATGCSLLDDSAPDRIVLPPTDELSTFTAPSTSTTTTSTVESRDTPNRLREGSIGRVISLAPRADTADYSEGAATRTGPRGNASGFHFSTPDRTINCSTSVDSRTLVCRVNGATLTDEPSTNSSGTDRDATSCDKSKNLVTLTSDGARLGLCGDGKEVNLLYRSTVLPYGTTITMSRISCLTDVSGLYCLESRSKGGFMITGSQFTYLDATDPAPKSMVNNSDADTDAGNSDGGSGGTGSVTDTAPEPEGDGP